MLCLFIYLRGFQTVLRGICEVLPVSASVPLPSALTTPPAPARPPYSPPRDHLVATIPAPVASPSASRPPASRLRPPLPVLSVCQAHMASSGYPDTTKAMYALSIIIIVATREGLGRPTPAPPHAMTPYGVTARAKAKDKAKDKAKVKAKHDPRPPERG